MTTTRWHKWGLYFSVMVALLLRVHNLGGTSLWNDEGNTVITARYDYGWTIAQALADSVHPPLFFLLEKLNVSLLGESEFGLRWLAAILGVLGVAAVGRLTHKWLGLTVASLSAVFLAVAPSAVWYSREARMYTLLLLLNIGAMYWFGKLLRTHTAVVATVDGPRRQLTTASLMTSGLFVLLSGGLYVAHYFGLFVPLIQFAFIVLTFRRHHRVLFGWTILQALAALPIAVWLYAQFNHGVVLKIGWIQPPTMWTLWNTWLSYTMGGTQIWQTALSLLVGLLVVLGLRESPTRWRWLLLLWLVVPAIVTFAFSLRRPLYVDRYFIGSLAPLLMLTALGLKRIWQIQSWAGALLAVVLAGSFLWQTTTTPDIHSEDWRGAVRYLVANEQPADLFVRRSIYYWSVDYYYTGQLQVDSLDAAQPLQLTLPDQGRLWLMFLADSASADQTSAELLAGLYRQAPDLATQQWLQSLQPFLHETRLFGSVVLLRYDFSSP